jgi:serine/threonine-protein kinase
MALGIFGIVRRGALSSKRLLDLGLVFQVIGALGIAVPEFWMGLSPTAGGSFFVPGECVWLVAYPLLVPNIPRKILVTSLLAASMGPAALAISAAATGRPVAHPGDAAVYFLTSNYMCAILAYVIARMVHRVNLQLKYAREIGSYELVERIGAGGMGEVWRAQHRLLAHPAAIKLIRSDMLGESQRAREMLARRFEREARATAALGSIHTVDVYDFGVTGEGDFYYVMELLDGLSIERFVQEFGAVEPGRAVYLLRQVCHSLAEAHARGLVHRDIKPANILICRLGPDDDFVKVVDFGLVKHTGGGTDCLDALHGRDRGWYTELHGAGNRARSSPRGRAHRHLLARLRRLLHADRATPLLGGHANGDGRLHRYKMRPCLRGSVRNSGSLRRLMR